MNEEHGDEMNYNMFMSRNLIYELAPPLAYMPQRRMQYTIKERTALFVRRILLLL